MLFRKTLIILFSSFVFLSEKVHAQVVETIQAVGAVYSIADTYFNEEEDKSGAYFVELKQEIHKVQDQLRIIEEEIKKIPRLTAIELTVSGINSQFVSFNATSVGNNKDAAKNSFEFLRVKINSLVKYGDSPYVSTEMATGMILLHRYAEIIKYKGIDKKDIIINEQLGVLRSLRKQLFLAANDVRGEVDFLLKSNGHGGCPVHYIPTFIGNWEKSGHEKRSYLKEVYEIGKSRGYLTRDDGYVKYSESYPGCPHEGVIHPSADDAAQRTGIRIDKMLKLYEYASALLLVDNTIDYLRVLKST